MTNNSERYVIKTQESVLAVRLISTWALPISKQFCEVASREIVHSLPERWALFADISHWCLQTEEACDYFFSYHKTCISMGLTHQVIVLPRSSLKRWRIKAFVSSDFGVKTYLAETEYEGLNWLRSKGFSVVGISHQLSVR